MTKYIQAFLDKNLFDLDKKDERVTYLEATVTALVEKIKGDKVAIVHHALLLIGTPVASDEPLLTTIESAIKDSGWKTYQQAYPNRSMPIIQAIVLEALTKVMAATPDAANLIWLACCDRLGAIEDGRQKEMILEFFMKVREAVEKLAETEWAVSPVTNRKTAAPLAGAPPKSKFKQIEVGAADLKKALGMASGPYDYEGVRTNQYWPNSGSNWANQFIDIGSVEISKVFNLVSKKQTEQIEAALQQLQAYVQSAVEHDQKIIQDFLKNQQETVQRTSQNIQHRSQLLWWRTAKYSPTLQKGYREVSTLSACLSLANDLSTLSGLITPLSMDFFLREAVREVLGSEQDSTSVCTLIQLLGKETTEDFRNATFGPQFVLAETRVLGDYLYSLKSESDCKTMTGVDPEQALTWEDFTVWHFHYLQLQKNLPQK